MIKSVPFYYHLKNLNLQSSAMIRYLQTTLMKMIFVLVRTCGTPTIKNVMRNLTLNLGDTARFYCKVDMKCMVSYIQWYHEMNNGSVRLLRTGATAGTPYSYTIYRVNKADSGFYSCVAGNILGESVSTAYLEISTVPKIELQTLLLPLVFMSHIMIYSWTSSVTLSRTL